MKELLTEFFANILVEAPQAKKNKPKKQQTDDPDNKRPDNARVARGGKWYTADPETGGEYVGRMSDGEWVAATPEEKEQERQQRQQSAQPTQPDVKPAQDGEGGGKKGKSRTGERAITADDAPDPDSSGTDIVKQLLVSNATLSRARRNPPPDVASGIGGPVPSYGEVGLTDAANQFSGEGYRKWRSKRTNQSAIKRQQQFFIDQYNEERNKSKKDKKITLVVETIAPQLGYDLPLSSDDEKAVLSYLAERRVYEDQELEKLRGDKKGIFYRPGKKGFGRNEAAARAWARAQFDGAHATNQLVAENSGFDLSQPYTVIQSDTRSEGHDEAIREHLVQMRDKSPEGSDDRRHYEEELDAFDHLKFHDTMAIGVDEKGRLSIYHISNKKDDDLKDIWNNTSPIVAIALLRRSLFATAAGASREVSARLVKVLDRGVEKVGNLKRALAQSFAEDLQLDEKFVQFVTDMNSGKFKGADKDYLSLAFQSRDVQAWLNSDPPPKLPPAVKKYLKAKGNAGTAARMKALQLFLKDKVTCKTCTMEAPGSIIRLMTKVAEIHNGKIDNNVRAKLEGSKGIEVCLAAKQSEKDVMKEIHDSVVKEVLAADKKEGFPSDGSKGNGPHTRSYIGTVMASMHFDSMVINYDKKLGVVTGIRGSTPADFRTCLARLSGFDTKKHDINSTDEATAKKAREQLNEHLLNTCKLDATSGAILIRDGKREHVIAQDAWRTSGTSKKVEKKIGDNLRGCIKDEVDARAKARRGK